MLSLKQKLSQSSGNMLVTPSPKKFELSPSAAMVMLVTHHFFVRLSFFFFFFVCVCPVFEEVLFYVVISYNHTIKSLSAAFGLLCSVILTFPGYLHAYYCL